MARRKGGIAAPQLKARKKAGPRRIAAASKASASKEPAPRLSASSERTSPADIGDRFSRTQWLAGILRERILDGTYKAGERIREVQLRDEFGFSNGPIREALQAIVADGLAERAPYHGVRIKQLDERELTELFQVRLALLEYAAELAARNSSEDLAASGAELKRDMSAAFDELEASGHPSFNGGLSQWLLTAAGNKSLHALWDKTMQQTLIYVNASLMRSHGRKSRAVIERLIDRICIGDVAGARGAARALTEQTIIDLGIKAQV